MTNKNREIHEIWLADLTGCRTRRPKNWSCAVGQRWVILYWNAKWLLAEQSRCCFKMHENCMEQRKQRVLGNGFPICMWASKPVVSVVTHNTSPGHRKTGPWSRALNAFLTLSEQDPHMKNASGYLFCFLRWRCVACRAWQRCTVQQQSHSSFHVH